MVSRTDPEANVTQYSYYPENNPNGDGQNLTPGVGAGPYGYLKQTTVDATSKPIRDSGGNPTPASIVNAYSYDPIGNLTRRIDARGIATDYSVNQLNQVVQVTRASAHNLLATSVPEPLPLTDFQYLTRIYYDLNDNVVHSQVEDRGNTSGTGGFVDTLYQRDILNNTVQMTCEVSTNSSLVSNYRYDANENCVLTVAPVGTATTRTFDERNLLFQVTRGATTTPPGMVGEFALPNSRMARLRSTPVIMIKMAT